MDIHPTFLSLMGIPGLIVAIVFHEVAHGYAAKLLGDNTASNLGRLTLNPIKHIDPFMSLAVPGMLILVGSPIIFGGAKPVPVDPRALSNPKKDMIWIAAAGPAINIFLGLIAYLSLSISGPLIGFLHSNNAMLATIFILIMAQFIIINVVLAAFNLFPVPPLDGGRIAVGLLPMKYARMLAKLEPFGLLIVVACLMTGLFETFLAPLIDFVLRHLMQL